MLESYRSFHVKQVRSRRATRQLFVLDAKTYTALRTHEPTHPATILVRTLCDGRLALIKLHTIMSP